MGLASSERRSLSRSATTTLKLVVLFAPVGMLFMSVGRAEGRPQVLLALGAMLEAAVCISLLWLVGSWRPPMAPSVVALYLMAFAWIWIAGDQSGDWYFHLVQSVLLAVPLGLLALQALSNSGGLAFRRARVLSDKLARRQDWPADLFSCRNLPEVKAFREALHVDATPALNLLTHPRMAVRVAALSALEFRRKWRPGQAKFVLELAERSEEPALRAAAVFALANVEDRMLVEAVAARLSDGSRAVRRAAAEALLWDSEERWPWIRQAVRQALSNPDLEQDGPLLLAGQVLPADAVADLRAWAAEKGILGVRAAQTLAAHYQPFLSEQSDEALIEELGRQLADLHGAPALRIELARLFQQSARWTQTLLEQLLDSANPAPLRLTAAEALLQNGPHSGAVAALGDIACLPNREIALATAAVVQRCLSVDMGLPLGQPLPPLQSRQAAEITRRVLNWSHQEQTRHLATPQHA